MEKIGTEIVTLLKKIQEVSKDYADIKDVFLDDSNMELLEDSVSVLKLLNNSRKALILTKFKFFLKGLNHESADKQSIEKLIDYVDNQAKAEIITNSFDKVITANSKLACCLMGLMLNDMIKTNEAVTQEELTILQALPMMNDYDVKNFHHLYKECDWGVGRTRIQGSKITKICDILGTTPDNVFYTINLLERTNLVIREGEVSLDIDEDDMEFSTTQYDDVRYFNTLSRKLYEYTCVLFQE